MESYKSKCSRLLSEIDKYTNKDIVIAFSGGVDSSLLLKLACESAAKKGSEVHAVTAETGLHPVKDIAIAKKVAEEAGAIHHVVRIDELKNAGIEHNPVDRCYLCKKHIFSELKKYAEGLNIDVVLEGTNEDDLHEYRPGIRALRELNILSPIADAGMTKEDVREMAREFGISVADRPSSPCLATRFPYGTLLSDEKMRAVEKGESYIQELGFYNVRIRVHEDIARIEVDEKEMKELLDKRGKVIRLLKDLGFEYITVDLEGFRSGSMDNKVKSREQAVD
ncbi:uncharacterized protein SAMN02745751_00569 [Dethiosulfatibacter aminovorans DSM 17477]|uniref:Asparagine synthetase domain-containing protein n=1 Tax=Dethiosulfatibacter aminovorans DSM 17477 TaxID=1121476 RepID=A0A1M6C3L5_9FIRM|nr:ATP-dependent sacrificial sulfur transferase LarE [Dethiosulfatibacter aminovorans]SHI55610.1 uncharacterized protein SAMN02745751_00569 [Dethiosulfatibacter aminovorans DSM 17477]